MPAEITNKRSHFGRAGQLVVMSEILCRGWNVAVPEVDVGSDVFVAQDDGSKLVRVQVKTAEGKNRQVKLSRQQLGAVEQVGMLYAFAIPRADGWDVILVERGRLRALREEYEKQENARIEKGGQKKGRKAKGANPSDPDQIVMAIGRTEQGFNLYGTNLHDCLNAWGTHFEMLHRPKPSQ